MESLIYDRKPTDFYNVSDLNRVEDWIQSLHKQIKAIGLSPVVKSKTPWTADSIPRQSAIDAVRTSIVSLKDAVYDETPDLWIYFDVGATKTSKTEWDAWEWDLHLISDTVDAIITNNNLRQSGTILVVAGGEIT